MTYEPIRVLQHLSCTGGTLFAKCLAAMPDAVLLSEVNPLSTQLFLGGNSPEYCPTDVIALARIAKTPAINELSVKLFLADMGVMLEHLAGFDKKLILREHSHSSFLIAKIEQGSNAPKTIADLLGSLFQCLSIITVRNPIDSYLSLRHNGWCHFSPNTFDEYCRRYLCFLRCNPDAPIFKYEHLVEDPKHVIREICDVFKIKYDDSFQDSLDIIKATGASGRQSDLISTRERRPYDEKFLLQVRASKNAETLFTLLDYESL